MVGKPGSNMNFYPTFTNHGDHAEDTFAGYLRSCYGEKADVFFWQYKHTWRYVVRYGNEPAHYYSGGLSYLTLPNTIHNGSEDDKRFQAAYSTLELANLFIRHLEKMREYAD